MFDPITTELIRSAPVLEGLDLNELPKRLTAAFAQLCPPEFACMGVPASSKTGNHQDLADLRRLAAVMSLCSSASRARKPGGAAFVAASAHQACIVGNPLRRRQPDQCRLPDARNLRYFIVLVAEPTPTPEKQSVRLFPIPNNQIQSNSRCCRQLRISHRDSSLRSFGPSSLKLPGRERKLRNAPFKHYS